MDSGQLMEPNPPEPPDPPSSPICLFQETFHLIFPSRVTVLCFRTIHESRFKYEAFSDLSVFCLWSSLAFHLLYDFGPKKLFYFSPGGWFVGAWFGFLQWPYYCGMRSLFMSFFVSVKSLVCCISEIFKLIHWCWVDCSGVFSWSVPSLGAAIYCSMQSLYCFMQFCLCYIEVLLHSVVAA
ncbi:unnamed protein product [Brassica napus]|uniref:(rape) hypothetical protein n=1 Tax=Brassica napus TaxID=3708 RepID=A0A816LME2_BRANA|nr:unnamed protein product [Brassica napus]